MGFEDWKTENQNQGFASWQAENAQTEPLLPLDLSDVLGPATETMIPDPDDISQSAGQIWDMSEELSIPLNESENIYRETAEPKPPTSDNLGKRFGKKFFNSAIGGIVDAVQTRSRVGASGNVGVEAATRMMDAETEFYERAKAGGPITLSEYFVHLSPKVRQEDGTIKWRKRTDKQIELWMKAKNQEIEWSFSEEEAIPFNSLRRFREASFAAEREVLKEKGVSIDVKDPESAPEKVIDAMAGIAGFTAQVALLKKASPTMPDWLVWENINNANGGDAGHGAAMQLSLGGISKFVPGTGFMPAIQRGTMASALFGTTTYLGGGDTVDIMINMGIPFAFEGAGLTKQSWAKYKNKKEMIKTIKEKAPALKNRPDVEIDKAISDLLTNVEMTQKFGAAKAPPENMSAEVKRYMQRVQYDQLLAKANAGNKKAIKELNDYVQGTNIPTYEQLLERGYSGDTAAFEQISAGNYQGGEFPVAELKIPRGKRAGAAYRPRTKIQRIKDNKPVIENDFQPPKTKLDSVNAKKARERGFVTSTKEIYPELKVEGQYIPRSTDRLAIKAKNLIKDNITQAEKVRHGTSDKSVAVAAELVKHYSRQGAAAKTRVEAEIFYDKAAAVANETAVMLTEAGRTVQAASILGRLTPEGQVRFAAREIQRFNEQGAKRKGFKKIPELSGKQTEYISKEMTEISNMPEGKARFMRFQKLQTHIGDLVPTPLYTKLVTTWKAGLLTGIKTSGLNIMSNAAHLTTETIKDVPASMIDKTVSYFTGKRTVTPTVKGLGKGTIQGLGEGLEYLKTGYSTRDIGTKLDHKRLSMGKGPLNRALNAYTDGVFRVLGAEDQPFYYAAKTRSMYEQAKVSAINNKLKGKAAQKHINELMNNPTERMIKNASMDAETAVYINSTKLGDIARGIQQLPGGEIIVPFGRTPSAVAMQIVNYSPIGGVKTIINNIGKGKFDQRAFSQGLGRSITGTAAMVIGVALYDNDMMTLDYPKTERERKLWELQGKQPNAVKIGGKWRTVQSFGPAGNLLIVGGHFRRAFNENGSPTGAMAEAMAGSAKTFTEQTFMQGVNQFAEAVSDPERSAPYVAGNMISSIIPTIVSDIARTTDPTERRAASVSEKLIKRIPGARRTLEPQITVLGEEKEPTGNPIELMIDPTRPSKEIETPVINELARLFNEGWEVSPALLGDRKGFDVLDLQENTELWKRTGTITKDALGTLIENELYEKLPDEAKAQAVSDVITAAQKGARAEMVAKKLQGLDDEKLAETLFALRRSGLADKDTIPIELSKRNPRKARKDSK